MLGDTLSNADNERDLGGDGLLDTGGGQRGAVCWGVNSVLLICSSKLLSRRDDVRDEDGGGSSASLLDGLADVAEDGETEVLLAGLLGVRSTDDLGAYTGGGEKISASEIVFIDARDAQLRFGNSIAYRSRWPVARGSYREGDTC